MQKIAVPALFFGLALAAGVIAWQGLDDVGAALSHAGFRLLWLAPYFLISLVLASIAWSVLFPPGTGPAGVLVFIATWIGMSINWLLPVAQLGGDIAKATWLARRAKPPAMMVATALVDKVLQTATQALVALVGVSLLLTITSDTGLIPMALGFALVILALVAMFIIFHKHGLLARLTAMAEHIYLKASSRRGRARADNLISLAGSAADVDAGVRETCRSVSRISIYLLLRLPSRLVLAGEIWLTLYFIGHPISILEALMVECLTQTARSAAFAVPGAYGVQETAFVLMGPLVGVPPDIALTVSLAKRMRELVIGLPSLIYVQFSEGLSARRPK